MAKTESKTLNETLVAELVKLKEKREALRLKGLPIVDDQSVMIPIPNSLVKDKHPEVTKFIELIGLINRNKDLGVPCKIEAGEAVKLTDGTTSTILELVFFYTDKTDIEAVQNFIQKHE